jgi:hypothetical protein
MANWLFFLFSTFTFLLYSIAVIYGTFLYYYNSHLISMEDAVYLCYNLLYIVLTRQFIFINMFTRDLLRRYL